MFKVDFDENLPQNLEIVMKFMAVNLLWMSINMHNLIFQ
jgi:hypothetical protein